MDISVNIFLDCVNYPVYKVHSHYVVVIFIYGFLFSEHMNTAEQLYEAFMEAEPKGSYQIMENDYPDIARIPGIASADVLQEFSLLLRPEDFEYESRGFTYEMMVSELMQKAIQKGDRRFELETHGIGYFPFMVQADERVQVVLNGDLGDGAVKGAQNLDVLVNGNAGDHLGIFGKNTRIYVTGTTGAFPMSQSENCVLDAESLGPNQLMVQDGVLVSRGDVNGTFYDAQKWADYLDEASPLIGPTGILHKNRFVVYRAMRKFNTTFLTAGKAKKPYVQIDYKKPDWVPSNK